MLESLRNLFSFIIFYYVFSHKRTSQKAGWWKEMQPDASELRNFVLLGLNFLLYQVGLYAGIKI